jgi:ABC-type uncharacterized transport system substrate-binding protein
MRLKKILCAFFVILFLPVSGFTEDKGKFIMTPNLHDGKKWRIGYYEGGEYIDYQKSLVATANALMDMGWIEKADIPPQTGEQTNELWTWLQPINSKFIEFVKDAHYSASWDVEKRKQTKDTLIKRLNEKKDIDLMLAVGTWAGQDLANNMHKTPTMVLSTADPVAAGIIKSIDDSGYDHIHARVDPFRFERQLKIFHKTFKFNKLGVAYPDTVAGKSYAALDDINKVSKERNFEVVRCFTLETGDPNKDQDSVKKCFDELGKTSDAIYVTPQGGIKDEVLPILVSTAIKYKLPTFSLAGSSQVRKGILMSISNKF